jgi:hypothetical protein
MHKLFARQTFTIFTKNIMVNINDHLYDYKNV